MQWEKLHKTALLADKVKDKEEGKSPEFRLPAKSFAAENKQIYIHTHTYMYKSKVIFPFTEEKYHCIYWINSYVVQNVWEIFLVV